MTKTSRLVGMVCSAALLVVSSVGFAGPQAKKIEYKDGADTFEGLLVTPEHVNAKMPSVLMIHNWMGLTDETKHQAERVAALGYVVFAADIYGKGVRPANAKDAGGLAGKYKGDRALFRKRLQLGLATLRAQAHVSPSEILAVGYCFGGTGALELARSGADLKGFVGFHAGLDSPTPADGKNIKGRVLMLQGADDPYVKAEDRLAFENEMRSNHVDWELVEYGNTVHSFTEKAAGNDNSKGAAYNAKADARSFVAFTEFAKETL